MYKGAFQSFSSMWPKAKGPIDQNWCLLVTLNVILEEKRQPGLFLFHVRIQNIILVNLFLVNFDELKRPAQVSVTRIYNNNF